MKEIGCSCGGIRLVVLELLWRWERCLTVLRRRYHRRRPVCGSGDDGDGSGGAAAADGGELVRCVQRRLTSMGEEEE